MLFLLKVAMRGWAHMLYESTDGIGTYLSLVHMKALVF